MKRALKSISMMLAVMLLATTTAFAAAMPTDIAGTSNEEAIKALVEEGVVTGEADGKFNPEANLTRAQACIMIVKTIDPPADMVNGTATQTVSKPNFSDLKGYSWAAGYIAYAVEHGIVKGYNDGTFKPGNDVTTNEMLTMILRAAGYTEDKIGTNWPADYITKATEVGILNNIGEGYPTNATKGMAAQMTYNQMKELKAMTPIVKDETPQGTTQDKPSDIPSTTDMTFTTGSFDSNLNSFAGKSVAKSVKIYTYGVKKDYKNDMKLSDKAEDYVGDTLYKFKDAKTPAWYLIEDSKITKMILPKDTGFSGNVYGVINETITDVNGANEAVTGFATLTATKPITWFGKKGLNSSAYNSSKAGDGQLFELKVSDGVVQNVATSTSGAKGKVFAELTTDGAWTAKVGYSNGVITVGTGLISVKDNASIYVWDSKKGEYRNGSLSSIKNASEVRAYDVSDDDVAEADVVIVK